jgi:phosphatidate cytidylyltransferase
MSNPFRFSHLKDRLISSGYMIILFLVFLGLVRLGWLALISAFWIVLTLLLIVSLFEWVRAFWLQGVLWKKKDFLAGGVLYLLSAFGCAFLLLKNLGPLMLLHVIVVCMVSDSLAYFAGSFFKGPLLLPRISPVKTWSGALCSWMGCFFLLCIWPVSSFCYVTAVLLPIVMQAGDLIESYAKRRLKIKDMGTLLKGHGGVLDRIDSWLSAFLFLGFWMVILKLQ